jgi:hypothetical protein
MDGEEHDVDAATRLTRAIIEQTSQKGNEAMERARQVSEQTTSTAQAIAAQAAAAAVARAEQAIERGASLADVAIERVPDVTRRLSDDIMPAVREAAHQAATTAIDMWQATRERAAEATHHADGSLLTRPASQAIQLAAAGTERARESSAAVAERAAERAAAIGESALEASRRTASKTAATGRDSGALLFWAGAAIGLIVLVLLSAERRTALLASVRGAANEVQAIVHDFRGYDDEF